MISLSSLEISVERQRDVKKSTIIVQDHSVSEADICKLHGEVFILFCLKDQERVCGRCLNSNHLLHPVVPQNSID